MGIDLELIERNIPWSNQVKNMTITPCVMPVDEDVNEQVLKFLFPMTFGELKLQELVQSSAKKLPRYCWDTLRQIQRISTYWKKFRKL